MLSNRAFETLKNRIICADAIGFMKGLPSESVNCIVTSPPYFGLRDYGTRGQIGLEKTPAEYVAKMVELFREARRVLKSDGTFWLNLGDSYNGSGKGEYHTNPNAMQKTNKGSLLDRRTDVIGLAPKNLLMIPARVAIALQDDGWYLRSEIVWHKCLSGGAWVYAQTQKGEMPTMVRDLARLDPATVKLWNGQKWTQVTGFERLARSGEEIELVLRSGERISCTPEHRWPTNRGLLYASELQAGDILEQACLPEPVNPYAPPMVTQEAAWFIGLYLAEGSRSGDVIQITGHTDELYRIERLQNLADYYGGSLAFDIRGNTLNIRLYGRFLNALIDQYISGKTAHDKGLKVRAWMHSNEWLSILLNGYLAGDGHYDELNNRWRISFTRNYNLERDLRVLSARLGFRLVLKLSEAKIGDQSYPSFRGEIRFIYGDHHNSKPIAEITEIRKSRCREVYDISVADDPHLFCLASGILTHNSNAMPESVKDRPTKAHEMIYLLTKSPTYWYDWEAIREPIAESTGPRMLRGVSDNHKNIDGAPGQPPHSMNKPRPNHRARPFGNGDPSVMRRDTGRVYDPEELPTHRNKRTVWTVPTQPFAGAHFATFPPNLIEPMILAGCPKGGIVLDMFMGSGTTALVARKLDRIFIGAELNPEYIQIAKRRLYNPMDMFLGLVG